jgi:NADH dehydrogenase
MGSGGLHVVTGAFGYTGRYIARRLLAKGHAVRTVTGHPDRPDPFGGRVGVSPLAFDKPGELVESLRGASVLYNTYWIRFARENVTFETAIQNTRILLRVCEEAGVRRVVHISISNPSDESPLPTFVAAIVERMIRDIGFRTQSSAPTCGVSDQQYCVASASFSYFPIRLAAAPVTPVFVDDLRSLLKLVEQENTTRDPVGPEMHN